MQEIGRPPMPGEVWRIDPTWDRHDDPCNTSPRYALVISHIDKRADEHRYGDSELDPQEGEVCRVLIESELYDLHWSWFRERISL